jgi:DNA-binding response OmpR family regulator
LTNAPALALLIVEGRHSFAEELKEKGYQVARVSTGSKGVALLDKVKPDVIVVDAASLRTNGIRICQSFRQAESEIPIILIITKSTSLPKVVDATLVLRMPFTVQKLVNRLQAYRETDEKYILRAGPIELNTKTQLVSCDDRHTKLTPRLVEILQILMTHHGEVVKRDPLFTEVWDTDYTGDTRTLDVHISWLRQAIEEDPSNPQLIQTERGVGYILDV